MAKAPVSDRRRMFATKQNEAAIPKKGDTILVRGLGDDVDGVYKAGKAYTSPNAGVLVGVRLQPKLLKKLDKHRGGQTRPQAIREILEKFL